MPLRPKSVPIPAEAGTRRRRLAWIVAIILPVTVVACSDGTLRPNVPLQMIPVDLRHSERMIDGARAGELAVAWARQFGPFNQTVIETGFGRRIRFGDLTAGPKYFAEAPYEELGEGYSQAIKKAAGPQWIVTLLLDNTPAIAVAVSALNTDVNIVNGQLELPRIGGNAFRFIGIRSGHEFPTSSMRARNIVSQRTGVPTTGDPVLVAPGLFDLSPLYARWRVVLGDPVTVESNAGFRQAGVRVLYVDHAGKLLVQTDTASKVAIHLPTTSDFNRYGPTILRLRSGLATRFVEVGKVGSGRTND